jgi:hypothetical protein
MIAGSIVSGMTMPGVGPLISLGIEKVITNNPSLVTYLYNCVFIFILGLIATSASERDSRFTGFLIPLWAAFCLWAGWLNYTVLVNGVVTINNTNGYAIVVICFLLAFLNYAREVRHQTFGIAGPGDITIKAFTFIVVLQCAVVFVNSAAIFPNDVGNVAESNTQYQYPSSYATAAMTLQNQSFSMGNSGGLLNPTGAIDIASATVQIAISCVIMLLQCLAALFGFSLVLLAIFPWIGQAGVVGLGFLGMLQIAIYIIYLQFIVKLFYKPGPDPNW